MNAVEIEEAISALAEQPFDAGEFPYAFLLAFGNKNTKIKRLRAGGSNRSDLGGVLQTINAPPKSGPAHRPIFEDLCFGPTHIRAASDAPR